ncbi:MAG: hypothetical protein AAGI53_05915 [Planctomycetota bacterium]
MSSDSFAPSHLAALALAALCACVSAVLGCYGDGGSSGSEGGGLAPTSIEGGTLVFDTAPDETYEFGADNYTRRGTGGIGGLPGSNFEVFGTYTYATTRGDSATLELTQGTSAFIDDEPVVLSGVSVELFSLAFATADGMELTGTAQNANGGSPIGFTLTGDFPSGNTTPPRGPIDNNVAPEEFDDGQIIIDGEGSVSRLIFDPVNGCTASIIVSGVGLVSIDGGCTYTRTSETTATIAYIGFDQVFGPFVNIQVTADVTFNLTFADPESGTLVSDETITVEDFNFNRITTTTGTNTEDFVIQP